MVYSDELSDSEAHSTNNKTNQGARHTLKLLVKRSFYCAVRVQERVFNELAINAVSISCLSQGRRQNRGVDENANKTKRNETDSPHRLVLVWPRSKGYMPSKAYSTQGNECSHPSPDDQEGGGPTQKMRCLCVGDQSPMMSFLLGTHSKGTQRKFELDSEGFLNQEPRGKAKEGRGEE